jgi:hypothetical protein
MGRRRDRQAMTALGAMEERPVVVAEPVITWAPCREDGATPAVSSLLPSAGCSLASTRPPITGCDRHCRGRMVGDGTGPGVRWVGRDWRARPAARIRRAALR